MHSLWVCGTVYISIDTFAPRLPKVSHMRIGGRGGIAGSAEQARAV
jgi:hypothetical protein